MQFHDQFRDVLLNPSLIIEVLSASTEVFDRGEKFRRYRTWLPTLQDYLLVAQDKPLIDHYHRVEAHRWEFVSVEGLKRVHLESLHCTLQLADVYDVSCSLPKTLSSGATGRKLKRARWLAKQFWSAGDHLLSCNSDKDRSDVRALIRINLLARNLLEGTQFAQDYQTLWRQVQGSQSNEDDSRSCF